MNLYQFENFSLYENGDLIAPAISLEMKKESKIGLFFTHSYQMNDFLFSLLKGSVSSQTSKTYKGTIKYNGQDIFKNSSIYENAIKKEIVFLEPNTSHILNPLLTIKNHLKPLLIYRKIKQKSLIEDKIQEVLEKVGLKSTILSFKPTALSGGMQQKLIIAMALIVQPRILVAYEPTKGLDAIAQKEIIQVLKDLSKTLPFLIISNKLPLLSHLCTHLAIFDKDSPSQLIKTHEILKTDSLLPIAQKLRNLYQQEADFSFVKTTTCVPKDPLLKLKDITYSYPNNALITKPLNLTINKNTITGLVGSSGCGKTTIAKLIVGLLEPSSGLIIYNGERVSTFSKEKKRAFHRKVGIIFQNAFLATNRNLSVRQILKEPSEIHPFNERYESSLIKEYLDILKIPYETLFLKATKVDFPTLQKITIIRSLLLEPELLIADEIFSFLPFYEIKRIFTLFSEIQKKRSFSLLMINHDLSLIYKVCEQIFIMKKGIIVESGKTQQLFTDPLNLYTKELIASNLSF
jgi:peptide/nickel transport system ATP-binding protein